MIENFDLRGTVKSGIPAIDAILGDGFTVGLHEISGASATAKTAFLLQLASKSEFPCIYLNTEMNMRDIGKRLVTINTKVGLNSIPGLPSDEREKLAQLTSNANTHLHIEDGNAGFVSINYLREKVLELTSGNPDTVLLVIDSFNEWVETGKASSDLPVKEFRANLRSQLIDLSKELSVTILISVQKKDSEKEVIEELEFASNTHLVFSWEKSGREDASGFKYLNIFFKKNRGGQAGKNKIIKFRGEIQEFS